jgi:hypothetical protein
LSVDYDEKKFGCQIESTQGCLFPQLLELEGRQMEEIRQQASFVIWQSRDPLACVFPRPWLEWRYAFVI